MDLSTLLPLGPLELKIEESLEIVNLTINSTNASTTDIYSYLKHERIAEGMYLMMIAVLGIFLNTLILFSVCLCGPLRQLMNSFIVHGCLLDTFKSAMCIPFALTLLNTALPSYCDMLGTSYVVGLTASMFNLVGMVSAEAYNFHVHNLNEHDPDMQGAVTCVLFGIIMIYIGSIILHLGPTLIGGNVEFNKDIGNCMFAYGRIQNYIVQAIWICIVTMTQLIVFRYIYSFYQQLKANQRFRITALARNAAAYTKGENPNESIYDVVTRLKRRVQVILGVSIVYFICWYPLFTLTMVDYNYIYPRYIYRILTIVAWSHSAVAPLILLIVDRSFGIFFQLKQMVKKRAADSTRQSPSRQLLTMSRDSSTSMHHPHTSAVHNGQRMNTTGSNGTMRSLRQTNIKSSPLQLVKQSSTHSSEHELLYEKVNSQLREVGTNLPGPSSEIDTIEARINQSRETDLLYNGETDLTESPC